MSVKKSLFALLALCGVFTWAGAQPSGNTPRSPNYDEGAARQLKTALFDLKHELKNHDQEIRVLEDRFRNLESSIDQLRGQSQSELQSHKDFTRAISVNLEGKVNGSDSKIDSLDRATKGVISDIRQIQSQTNETVASLNQLKERLQQMEKFYEAQMKHMASLEAALQSMVDLVDTKNAPIQEMARATVEGIGTYKVQAGDTLEKIAKVHKVSLQNLKDANQLTSDRIIIGQTLKIPG